MPNVNGAVFRSSCAEEVNGPSRMYRGIVLLVEAWPVRVEGNYVLVALRSLTAAVIGGPRAGVWVFERDHASSD